MTHGKESLLYLYAAAAEMPGLGNRPAQLSIGQSAGGWLSALKDVKEKVQSVAPALPKLLPNVVAELTVQNTTNTRNVVDNLPVNSCGNLASKDSDLPEKNNDCVYIQSQPVDGVSAQMPESKCTHDDDLCRNEAAAKSSQLSSELLTKLCVDESSISDDIRDHNSSSSVRSDAIQSSNPDEHSSQPAGELNNSSSHALGSVQTSSYDNEQNRSSPENEAEPYSEAKSQPVVAYTPTEIRNFSADVTDSPDIIFASSRKKRKPSKQGIYVLTCIYCVGFVHY